MSTPPPVHADRRRAESFGAAADDYDRHRPRYPRALIDALVTSADPRVLDVGAGTGIASLQLAQAGARVLAVEPDPRMARVAAAKGIAVEQGTFEQWDPAGRTFDLVVFAQSFHWVDPGPALEKVARILAPRGRLALVWNRITPTSPTDDDLREVYADYLADAARPSIGAEDRTTPMLEQCGFATQRHDVVEHLHFGTEDWLDLVFTYSNHLALQPDRQTELRSRLSSRIGPAGLDARNDALAIVCTLRAEA